MQDTTKEIIAKDKAGYLPVFSRYQIALDHGEGAYVWDVEGKKYLDFLGGIAVNVLGHNYPPLAEAVAEQAHKLIHCSNLYYTRQQAEAAEKLARISGLEDAKVFFGNSGAEANEGAIKLARKFAHQRDPEKSEIITAWMSFHGRTLATLTATGQPHYQEGVGPLPGGFSYVHYNDIGELKNMISSKTCAVLLETIQGEGGVFTPEGDYLKQVRELCDEHDALLILDEIQAGIGRSGCFFAYDKYGIKPDIVTLAKGLAGGVPIGAFIARGEVARAMQPGDHGTTFGGNPLACAAANVVLDLVPQPSFLEQVAAVGEYFFEQLESLQQKYPQLIREVRGTGLILGAELTREDIGRKIVNECLERGVIINCTVGKVLRFIPPLIIVEDQVDEMLAVLSQILSKYD